MDCDPPQCVYIVVYCTYIVYLPQHDPHVYSVIHCINLSQDPDIYSAISTQLICWRRWSQTKTNSKSCTQIYSLKYCKKAAFFTLQKKFCETFCECNSRYFCPNLRSSSYTKWLQQSVATAICDYSNLWL